jgi:hypothetical protein
MSRKTHPLLSLRLQREIYSFVSISLTMEALEAQSKEYEL